MKDIDQLADDFLKKNDETYYKQNKTKLISHPYLSERQLKRRRSAEIPAGNLSKKQMRTCPKMSDCYNYEEV